MIRPYGPGKCNTILDSYVYDVSLIGCDDETGSVDDGTWYGLMRHGRTIFKDHDPFCEALNDEERDQLTGSAGVIISEDSQGFVIVSYHGSAEALDEAWAKIAGDDEAMEDEDD